VKRLRFPDSWLGDAICVLASGLLGGLVAGVVEGFLDDISSPQSLEMHLAHDVPWWIVFGLAFTTLSYALKLRRNGWRRKPIPAAVRDGNG